MAAKELTMTFVNASVVLAIAGLIVGGVVLLLRKKQLPLPPIPLLRAKPRAMSPQEEAALSEQAQRAVSQYPELGSTPAELLTELSAYCTTTRSWSGDTPRIILEKLLASGSLQKAMSYWQVKAFLEYRDELKKSKRTWL
jgi:hypothetical protein